MQNSKNSFGKSPRNLPSNKHIIEDKLDKKNQLIDKYQSEIQGLLEQIDQKSGNNRKNNVLKIRRNNREKISSTIQKNKTVQEFGSGTIEYQKLILGLQYTIQLEKSKSQALFNQNNSLLAQISNLRNLLVGPDEQKHYEKTVLKQFENKILYLEKKIIEHKKNYQFIIDSKNEIIQTMEKQLQTIRLETYDPNEGWKKKSSELMSQVEEIKHIVNLKNIRIQRLKYHSQEQDGEQEDKEIKKIHKMPKKLQFYSEQLEIANKLLVRKNIEIINLNNKIMKQNEVFLIIEQYIEKKQVKNVDLNILEHPCVTKIRILLREKAVFQRQLLNELNEHNKRINLFENQIVHKQATSEGKVSSLYVDNKRLAGLVSSLQTKIRNLEHTVEQEKNQNQYLKTQIQINKAQFLEEIKKFKGQIGTISSVTKNQFDRMKIQNLKLTQQNRSLLFLVGQKQRQIHTKGEAIRTYKEYKGKINSLEHISQRDRHKVNSVSEQGPQIGSKIMLIESFSNWLFEWKKIRNWVNKKALLNLILDKQILRKDSLNFLSELIGVLHECFLQSKDIQVQQRTTVLLAYYLNHHQILKTQGFYLNKIAPIIVRGLRSKFQGQETTKYQKLGESSSHLLFCMAEIGFKWTNQMTNEMLGVNGLKYIFETINHSQIESHIQYSYRILIMIVQEKQMISFINSFNITQHILENLNRDYSFLFIVLQLLKNLLSCEEYMRTHKSLLQFRRVIDLLKMNQDQIILLTLQCLILLMQNQLFVKSCNKLQILSLLVKIMGRAEDYNFLKKAGNVYTGFIFGLQTDNIVKFQKQQLPRLIGLMSSGNFGQNLFGRVLRILHKIVLSIVDNIELDGQIIMKIMSLYQHYSSIQQKTRMKINQIFRVIFERNKEVVSRFCNETFIVHLIQAYKMITKNQQIILILQILLYLNEQKNTTQILRSGRQSYINKLVNDALLPDYQVAIAALKNILFISLEKYSQKFLHANILNKIINQVLSGRGQEDYICTSLNILYHMSRIQGLRVQVVEAGIVPRLCTIITERYDKQNIIYKCLAVLQVVQTNNFQRKVLNYLLINDNELQILKTINWALRKSKNKAELGPKAVFIYDYLNSRTAIDSLILLIERNLWMIEDMIMLRNQYVNRVEALVYKIQLLLHAISTKSDKIRVQYQRFRVEDESDD